MPSKKPRLSLTLEPEVRELLGAISVATGIPETTIVNKLLTSHMSELWEYRTWLESLPETDNTSRRRALGINLLTSYGPDDLVTGLKKLDPTYKTMEEQFKLSLEQSSDELPS